MVDLEKLINLDLELEHLKKDIKIQTSLKSHLFEALYMIQQFHGLYKFWDLLFIIIEFIQLMAFPMDKIFNETWGIRWVKTIGNFFRFSQLVYFWRETSFFMITYIITCFYIIILLILFLYIVIKVKHIKTKNRIKILVLMLQIQIVLNIPFLRTLFSVFSCVNGSLEIEHEIKCKSGIHIALIFLSIIFLIIYNCLLLLFHFTLYEFGTNPNKLKSAYNCETEIALDITKLILIIIYQFISGKNQKILAIITLSLSIILLCHFLAKQPYSSAFTMKLYLVLYALFCWSCIMCLISIFLKNSKFQSGVVLLLLGYPFILIIIYLISWDYSIDKLLSFVMVKMNNKYKSLLKIEYFLKLEDSLSEKAKTCEFKLLFFYILNHEGKCAEKDCCLKRFMNIPFRIENYDILKILLLQHAEVLYRVAISKEPDNIKLRISYILFLYKKMNKKSKGKNELTSLNKFQTNLECSFLLYRLQKYVNKNKNDKEQIKKVDQSLNYSHSLSYKLILNKIKTMIENIIIDYTHFWNILLESDWKKKENFIKMSKLGNEIKRLDNDLNKNVISLESWNLLDQNTFKNYIYYLKEILNDTEKANEYNKKIMEIYHNKHRYDEINLYELNYEEMAKNEDYKYIIVNCSSINFNKIVNISCSACKLFGYTRKELIGRYSDILFPEILNNYRKIYFEKKISDYRHNLFKNNITLSSDLWTGDSVGIDKNNFLITYKAKWTLVPIDDEKIYGIGNILLENKQIITDKEQEIIYILTDDNFVMQNFSSNGIKLLNLNPNFDNNFSTMYEYIVEFNETYGFEKDDKKEKERSSITKKKKTKTKKKQSKADILKKYSIENSSVKVIHWKATDLNEENDIKNKDENNNNNYYNSSTNGHISYQMKNKFQRASHGNFLEEKNKIRLSSTPMKIKSGMTLESYRHLDMLNSKISNDSNSINNQKVKDKDKEKLFTLRINEAKIHEYKAGYIFILKPFIKPQSKFDTKKELINVQENKNNMNVSEISIVSFGEEKYNKNNIFNADPQAVIGPFNLTCQNNDLLLLNLDKDKENQFTFDVNDKTYKQFRYITNSTSLYDNLKEKAIQKLTDFKRGIQVEESEEEEESSEYEETNEENEDNSLGSKESPKEHKDILTTKSDVKKVSEDMNDNLISNESSKNNKLKILSSKKLITEVSLQNTPKTVNETNKKKEEDFYHVNLNKISFFIFNFSSGFVELQKGQQHKISHVTYLLNIEKEKAKNPNSRFLANTKFIKGKKKGIIKKEENEVNTYSNTSLKLKEIYKILSAQTKESVIVKVLILSIIIFVFVLGTGLLNILMYLEIKKNIYNFYILIQKSESLYKNILFEIMFVKEMLAANNPYYYNKINNNNIIYYGALSKRVYNYYLDNAFIISNLTNHFNILTKKDEDSITKNKVELYIIDPLASLNFEYQYKKYSVLLYSAYRELNSALYHISQMKLNEIYQYDDDVFYLLKNGMSNLLIASERQIWILTEKFANNIKSGHILIIICCCSIFVVYILCAFFFIKYYSKVVIKKNKYLSIFEELDNDTIISSLQKCEKFTLKLQDKKSNKEAKEKYDINSSSENNSDNDNDNNPFIIEKKNENEKNLKFKNEKNGNIRNKKYMIYQVLLFLILFVWQIIIYIYYYQRTTYYEHVITYEYYISMYASNFLFIFISFREYIFDRKSKFLNQTVDEYLDYTLDNYYTIFSESSRLKDIYRLYFPDSYQDFLNYLYNEKLCEFIGQYNSMIPKEDAIACDAFFYRSSGYGFFNLLATYVEEIRTIKDKVDSYYNISDSKNFTYNETYFNDPKGKYDTLYQQYKDDIDEYKKYNPANILHSNSHKKILITYLYIHHNVYSFLVGESLHQFESIFKKYNSINLILNIVFIIVIALGFIFLWLPFVYSQNKIILKIKNMLSIIPSDLLMNVSHINRLIGIEEPMI